MTTKSKKLSICISVMELVPRFRTVFGIACQGSEVDI